MISDSIDSTLATHYYFISENGKIELQNWPDIDLQNIDAEERPILVLDSSVCMDIVDLINKKESCKADKVKIFNLIAYAQINKIEHFALYALLELSYDRTTLKINEEKFFDYKNKLDYAFGYPIKRLKNFDYDFIRDYGDFVNPEFRSKNIIVALKADQMLRSYAALLKICEISQNGLRAEKAEKNIVAFIEWMVNDLGVILGFDYMLALQIFGGNTEYGRMLNLGGKNKDKVLSTLSGTAWDLFHAKMSCNRNQLSKIIEDKVYPVFVTNDMLLFELISPTVLFSSKSGPSRLNIVNGDSYPPNYTPKFMATLKAVMLGLAKDRFSTPPIVSSEKVLAIIKNLEDNLFESSPS